METIPDEIVRSVRRSRGRLKTLLVVAAKREAYVGEIARATGLRDARVAAALVGRRGTFRPELGLVQLGLVERAETPLGRVVRVTPLGLELAPRLASELQADALVREFADLARVGEWKRSRP